MVMVIPEQHYVGFRAQNGTANSGRLPLGFATPYGTDAAARKRMATVDNWSTPYAYHGQPKPDKIEPKVIVNELLPGFRLCEEVRRHSGWGNGNVVWRIEDPRGFELEISSPNFASILDCTTIINGEIQGRCVWGRDGGTNVLLPEASAPYIEAAHLTKLSKQKVSAKDIKAGDKLRLKDGRDVLFLGTYIFLVYSETNKYDSLSYRSGTSASGYRHVHNIGAQRKRQVFIEWEKVVEKPNATLAELIGRPTYKYDHAPQYTYFTERVESATDMKVGEILERGAYTVNQSEVCDFVNGLDAKTRDGYAGVDNIIAVGVDTFGKTLAYELREISMSDVQEERSYFTKDIQGVNIVCIRKFNKDYPASDTMIPIDSALKELGRPGIESKDRKLQFRTSNLPVYEMVLKTARGDIPVNLTNIF